jgi:peroxiredoxin Q/BCP
VKITSLAKLGSLALVVVTELFGCGEVNVELRVGDQAPAFALQGSDGHSYSLADFRDKSAVVLAWFPKAFTGG